VEVIKVRLCKEQHGRGRKAGTIGGGAKVLCKPIPIPSKMASRQAHPIAEFRIDRGPACIFQPPQIKDEGVAYLE